jgi:hypothetical protein
MSIAFEPTKYRRRPAFIVPIAFMLLVTFGVGPNFLLVMFACIVLIVGVNLLWRPGEVQILLYIFGIQWLQVTSTLCFANIRGVPVSELLLGFPAMGEAAILVLVAILVLAIGMRLGAGPQRHSHLARARAAIASIPPIRWLQLHVVMWGVSTASLLLAATIPGLSQPLLALANFKWATFVILTIVTFARQDASRILWFVVFGVEFLSAIGGYFSSFKFVFVFTLVAITAVDVRIKVGQIVGGGFMSIVLITLGVYWTAIKGEYRYFVSGGQQAQVVVVSPVEAFEKIIDLVAETDAPQLKDAAERLAHRFAELNIFSAVLLYVPAVVPHEGGALWWDAVSRPFMPRILFQNKAIIDESELSRRYTGIQMAGIEQGTQISMGYIADSYIDFSKFGMWGVILAFGYSLGRIYRWLVEHPNGHGILGFGLCTSILIQVGSLGFSSAKLVGGILVSVLVATLVLRIAPIYITWLRPGKY